MNAPGVPYVGVIGASRASAADALVAEQVGRELALAGAVLVCGGGSGVMEAACRGASGHGGLTIGYLPGLDRRAANPHVQVVLPTGLGELRNGLIIRASEAVIAVGGAYGTLSEIALALSAGLVVAGVGTWEIDGVTRCGSALEAVKMALSAAAATVGGAT